MNNMVSPYSWIWITPNHAIHDYSWIMNSSWITALGAQRPHMQLLKIPCNSKHRLNNDNVGRIHVSQCHKSNESLWKESISKFLSGRYVLICGYSPKFHPICGIHTHIWIWMTTQAPLMNMNNSSERYSWIWITARGPNRTHIHE